MEVRVLSSAHFSKLVFLGTERTFGKVGIDPVYLGFEGGKLPRLRNRSLRLPARHPHAIAIRHQPADQR